jgi:hypothetical protein
MYNILERLLAFIEPPADQWDNHQIQLEQITARLLDMMRECRRPHDLQNEVRKRFNQNKKKNPIL